MSKEFNAPSSYSSEIISSKKIEKKRPNYTLRRIGTVAVLSATLLLAGKGIATVGEGVIESFKQPTLSEATFEYYVEPGETLWDIVKEIDNINEIDIRQAVDYVQAMPENEEIFENNRILHSGDIVTLPEEVIND